MMNQMYKYTVNVNYIAEDPVVGGGIAGSFTIDVEARDSFDAKRAAYSEMVDVLNEKGYKNYNITVSDVLMLQPEATGTIMKDQNEKEDTLSEESMISKMKENYKHMTLFESNMKQYDMYRMGYEYQLIIQDSDENPVFHGEYTIVRDKSREDRPLTDTTAYMKVVQMIHDDVEDKINSGINVLELKYIDTWIINRREKEK